jgi:biotin synthase
MNLSKQKIIDLLLTKDDKLEELYKEADSIREKHMGDEVYLRGILEISNYCKKSCNYCGIRAKTKNIYRYRMNKEEIIEECIKIEKNKMTTVVLQAGEDSILDNEYVSDIIKEIKNKTNLAITLSLGVQKEKTFLAWKDAGMDRYLLRYESSNPIIFEQAHPDDNLLTRLGCLKYLKEIGIQCGSGFLIGIPGQSLELLAEEIIFCTNLNLDMIGIGPFIPHPDTPYGKNVNIFDADIFFKVISILRIMNPKAHIPSTTAYDAIIKNGRNLLLQRGANVFMPNATPMKYRKHYQLYPNKPCINESSDDCAKCVQNRILSIKREIGRDKGHSKL